MSQKFSILIENGFIVDGSGSPAYKRSLGTVGERIAAIGEISSCSADIVIDAENLTVTPGFIDPHSHVDQYILICPTVEDYVMQGVTTVIAGNCGYSSAPVKDFYLSVGLLDARLELRKPYMYEGWSWVLPWNTILPLDEFGTKAKDIYDIDIDWRSFAEFLSRIEEEGTSVNFVPLVGHGNVRLAVMGLDYKRKATGDEVEEMKELVAEAMEAGAFGMSTGRDYPPQDYADTEEVTELAKVVKNHEGFYFTHYSGLNANGLKEAAEIGKRSGAPVHISHLITAYEVVPVSSSSHVVSPRIPETLLESAAYETLNVADKFIKENIFTSFCVVFSAVGGAGYTNYLAWFLRPWLEAAGSRLTLAKCLKIQDFRKEVKEAIDTRKWPLGNYWGMRIVSCKNKQYLGKTIAEIAGEERQGELDTLLNIVIEDPDTRLEYSFRDETQIRINIKHPYAMPSLDKVVPIYGSWKKTNPLYQLPYEYWDCYPLLSTGGFPLYFRRFVRELRILTLEEAVRKATSLPAQTFKIKDRGILEKGAYADIAIFNSEEIRDMGDSVEPLRPPSGLEYVIVNGKIVFEKNQHTGIRTGKVVRKNAQN